MTDPVSTTCMRCAVGCGHVHLGAENGYGIDTVRGDPAHPVTQGLACGRGIRESADPGGEWLTRPLRREDGELVPTTWDRALSVAGRRLEDAADRTPNAVAVLGSGQQTNEAAYALGKLARGGIGTRFYDANTTLCMASAVTAYYEAFGSDAPPPTYDDIPAAETHLVWGANPAAAHPVLFQWIQESARDDELVVVDPVESATADLADRHVAPDPGTDLALARGALARLVETGRVDRGFVAAHTEGFDGLLDTLPGSGEAAAVAGVREETVEAMAGAFEQPTLVYWGMGVNQSTQGTDTARALIDLCLASGNLGPGSGPFSLTGQANSMGTRVCSSKGTWPGHRPFESPAHRRTVADHWDVPVEQLPEDPGPGPVGILEAVDDGVEVIWTVATNPAAGMPDARAVRDRLDGAFVIAQDAFRSETVEYADVVLPAATWGESDGTTINMERTVSRVRSATDTPRGVRTDLELIVLLGERIAPGLFDSRDPASIFEEFVELTEGTPADCSGLSYERLDEEHAVRWPAPDQESAGGYRFYVDASGTDEGESESSGSVESATSGSAVSTAEWRFETASGLARFSTGRHRGLPEPPDERYPLLLTTGRDSDRYNTGVRTREDDDPVPRARVGPATAEAMLAGVQEEPVFDTDADGGAAADANGGAAADADGGIDADADGVAEDVPLPPAMTDLEARGATVSGDDGRSRVDRSGDDRTDGRVVRVASRRGSIRARVALDDAVPVGVVWLPVHDPAVNELTLPAVDPRSDEPAFKQCAVRLAAPGRTMATALQADDD